MSDALMQPYCAVLLPFRAHFLSPYLRKNFKKRGDQTVLWSNRLIGIFCCVRINRQFWVAHIHMLQGRHWLVRCPLCNTPSESSDRQYSFDCWNPAWFRTSSINHRLQVAEGAVPQRWQRSAPHLHHIPVVHQQLQGLSKPYPRNRSAYCQRPLNLLRKRNCSCQSLFGSFLRQLTANRVGTDGFHLGIRILMYIGCHLGSPPSILQMQTKKDRSKFRFQVAYALLVSKFTPVLCISVSVLIDRMCISQTFYSLISK